MSTVSVAVVPADFRCAGRLIGECVVADRDGYGDVQLTIELADVAAYYAAPSGRVLLGWPDEGDEAVGVAAVRRLNDTTAELRRLYVRPGAHTLHRRLVLAAVGVALELHCAVLRLPRYHGTVYRDLGFVDLDGNLSVVLDGGTVFEHDLPAAV